jgi:hypothetical protein
VGALADDDVGLLVADLGEELGETADWKKGESDEEVLGYWE